MLIALLGGGDLRRSHLRTQLVHPGGDFANPDSAAFDIAKDIGADLFASIFLAASS